MEATSADDDNASCVWKEMVHVQLRAKISVIICEFTFYALISRYEK
jgi:hypothetical protein